MTYKKVKKNQRIPFHLTKSALVSLSSYGYGLNLTFKTSKTLFRSKI